MPLPAQATMRSAACPGPRQNPACTSEEAHGARRGRPRRLVAACPVPRTGNWFADLILWLPTAATVELPMRLNFLTAAQAAAAAAIDAPEETEGMGAGVAAGRGQDATGLGALSPAAAIAANMAAVAAAVASPHHPQP